MPICGLCLKEKELRESHLIPKSIYKAIRNSFPDEEGGILIGRTIDKHIKYTDYQIKNHFLCNECEGILSKYGEVIVSPECHHGKNKFRLLDKLNSETPRHDFEDQIWYIPDDKSAINTKAYLHFGASVFWRASAGNWKDGIGKYKNALGSRYQEELRKFILGETSFPKNMYLGIYVDSDIDIVPFVSFPEVSKKDGYHHHIFYIPGIKFSLIVGNKTKVSKMAKHFNTQIFFIKYSFKKHPDYRLLHHTVNDVFVPKGRLNKEILAAKRTN